MNDLDAISVCSACGALVVEPQACAACRKVAYCGPACQRAHWKVHKKYCKDATAARFNTAYTAAKAGEPSAQFEVSLCYEGGFGVAKDAAQAKMWLHRAAEAGYHQAQNHLGHSYQFASGVEDDPSQTPHPGSSVGHAYPAQGLSVVAAAKGDTIRLVGVLRGVYGSDPTVCAAAMRELADTARIPATAAGCGQLWRPRCYCHCDACTLWCC